jgi:Leucine-rich repeat (LRR) protein
MKKIISIILLSTISLSSFADGVFNMQIPQPDFVSNDWDGDGDPNLTDPDDDNDGIDDIDDSTPFGGRPGGSSTPPYVYKGDTCKDDSLLLQETVDELNVWSGLSNSSAEWCSLTYLNLPSKMLTSIPESVGGLSSIYAINLPNNQITDVPESIGELPLTILYLQGNQITEIPKSIGNLANLHTLHLNNNNLVKFPPMILNLPLLEVLHLDSNDIKSIPENINVLSNLRRFYVHGNEIEELPNSLNSITSLTEYFYMYSNPGAPFNNISCDLVVNCKNY